MIGGLSGAFIGYLGGDDEPEGDWNIFVMTAETKAFCGAIIGVAVGGRIGGLIAAL